MSDLDVIVRDSERRGNTWAWGWNRGAAHVPQTQVGAHARRADHHPARLAPREQLVQAIAATSAELRRLQLMYPGDGHKMMVYKLMMMRRKLLALDT